MQDNGSDNRVRRNSSSLQPELIEHSAFIALLCGDYFVPIEIVLNLQFSFRLLHESRFEPPLRFITSHSG